MYKKLSNLNVGDIFQILELKFNNFKCPDGEISN